MNYTHDEVKAIIKFVLEEERLLDLAEQVQPMPEEDRHVEETMPEVTAEEKEKPSAPKPLDSEKIKRKKARAKQIDHGKIIALHNGKWPVAKIADEMGCSEQTVRNHIAMEEKK